MLAANVAATTNIHSLLVAHPGWYGEKYYAPFYGYEGAILLEQSDITGKSGIYIKFSTYGANAGYNLTFANADRTADYLLIQDFFDNLYIMRFGSNSAYYVNLKSAFETDASHSFNLVYSTGTDRLYENRHLGCFFSSGKGCRRKCGIRSGARVVLSCVGGRRRTST